MKNPNHPPRGSTITAEPIRDLSDIETIRKLLSSSPRDLLLFTLGINSCLRLGEILSIRVGQVRDLKPGDLLTVPGGRGEAKRCVFINKTIHKALRSYLREVEKQNCSDGDYLFRSRKGANSPLSTGAANALIKSWTRAINLRGNYGAHSLRKTFGYIQRTRYGVGLDVLARHFHHSSPSLTLRYLGLKDREVTGVILHDI